MRNPPTNRWGHRTARRLAESRGGLRRVFLIASWTTTRTAVLKRNSLAGARPRAWRRFSRES